ncbi:MAG: iron ABC transporter permease, partial [Emcibacteraceae bacterium]|nr:iron ABC transporter permease [Emcibacteraceae bacterium]
LLGILIGAALGVSGAALQGVLRNPLADPGVIGVSASAALGAVIAIHLGLQFVWPLFIPIFAMSGALLATLILLTVSLRESSVLMLILIGIGISSLAMAGVSLVMNFAVSPMSVRDMIMWMLGSLENRTTTDLMLSLPFIILGWLMMINVGQGLNALSVGEDTAQSMGINTSQLKLRIVVGSAISVGAAVAACGSIGFVGLVVPHMVRGLITNEPGGILLPSALMGGLLLTLADLLTRVPMPGATLQLGVVTSLVGAPAFLYIIYKTRKNMR